MKKVFSMLAINYVREVVGSEVSHSSERDLVGTVWSAPDLVVRHLIWSASFGRHLLPPLECSTSCLLRKELKLALDIDRSTRNSLT